MDQANILSEPRASSDVASLPFGEVRRVGLLLLDGFSLVEFALILDSLRLANELAGLQRYATVLISLEESFVRSCAGTTVRVDTTIAAASNVHELVVVGSRRGTEQVGRLVLARLRWMANRGAVVCGLSNGVFLLARAGLLNGQRCAVHWLYHDAFRETFPTLETTTQLFHVARSAITCVGGAATLDLMVARIAADRGWPLALALLDRLAYEHPRTAETRHQATFYRLLRSANPSLAHLVELMERNLSEPLSREALAQTVRLSRRQVERWFRRHLGCSPQAFYRELRLTKARNLLLFSELSVTEVATATGFDSLSNFAKVFRRKFGYVPSHVRRRHINPERQPRPRELGMPSVADAFDSYLDR